MRPDTPGKEPSQRHFLHLAVPNLLAAVAVPLAQLVNLAFLGHAADVTDLSGVILATVIFDYIFWSFGFLRMGTTGLVAQAAGQGNDAEQANLFWRGLMLALGFSSMLVLLQQPISSLAFTLLSGGSAVTHAGEIYYNIHIWGAIPNLVNYVCIGWLFGRQQSRKVLYISLIWEGINVLLDYVLIMRLGWGVRGAGYAILLAEWIGMFAALYFVRQSWGGIPHFHRDQALNWPLMKQLLHLNSAILMRTFLLISAISAYTNISASFGTVALAGNALLLRLWSATAHVIDGFALALESLAGTYAGANNPAALKRSFQLCLRWSLIICTAFLLLFWLGEKPIFNLLTDHEDVKTFASAHMPWLLSIIYCGGFAFTLDGFFFGLARGRLLFKTILISVSLYAPVAMLAYWFKSPHLLWSAMLILVFSRAATLWFPAMRELRLKTG